jgi:hypothetical protein
MLRPSASRQDSRKKSFKKSADAEESRRKREDQMIAIRKEKREEAMAKKRINVGGGGSSSQQSMGGEINPNVFDASDSTAMTHEQRTNAKVLLLFYSVYAQRSPLRVRGVCPRKGGFTLQKQKGERRNFFPRARRAIALFVFVILATRRFILSLSLSLCVCLFLCVRR